MPTRTEAYNQAIIEAQNAKPDYQRLEVLWTEVSSDRIKIYVNKKYLEVGLTEDQLQKIVIAEVAAFRKSLTEEQFQTHLNDLHNQTVEAAVKQLEFERDNPDKASERAPSTLDDNKERKWSYEEAVLRFLIGGFINNLNGVENESGEGARVLRATLGISILDIEKYGILGGDNSYLRKIIPTWNDGGGVFGGENSFFRKPFG